MAITAREKAQAAEALNRHPGLSPAARRLGIELLNRIDRRTGIAWPSEARLAETLGYCDRTIRRAKAELKAAGLLTWTCRGQHKTPLYALVWEALRAIGARIKAKITAAFSRPKVVAAFHNSSGRTFQTDYLTQVKFKGALEGRGTALGAKTSIQLLTDPQLNARAHSRLWSALRNLAPAHLAQVLERLTEQAEAEAVRTERYHPGSGLMALKAALQV